jgi:hypothetical protein
MTSARPPFVLRALAALGLVLLLAAPTPGAVGSCGSGGELTRFADLQPFCKQSEQLKCVRRALRKELTDQQRDDCRRAAIMQCEQRSWAPGCHPIVRQTRACLNALSALDTLQTKERDIVECNTTALCAVATTPVPDAGMSDGGGQ